MLSDQNKGLLISTNKLGCSRSKMELQLEKSLSVYIYMDTCDTLPSVDESLFRV